MVSYEKEPLGTMYQIVFFKICINLAIPFHCPTVFSLDHDGTSKTFKTLEKDADSLIL